MTRFEFDAPDTSSVRRARDTTTGRVVVLERGVRSERSRQLQAIPKSAAIAPFERVRVNRRVQIVHPAPLEFADPIDEFDVAHAIGSLLDGLAWLHAHHVTHGAIDEMALTSGPTGGRLSLAGAFSQRGGVAPPDDVYAASALAFNLLVGEAPTPEALLDDRLALCASPPVAEAVRAGLDPDPSQRPSAASLATMVRGEWLPSVAVVAPFIRWPGRVRSTFVDSARRVSQLATSATQALRPFGATVAAGIGAVIAMVILFGGLAEADQKAPHALEAAGLPAAEVAPVVLAAHTQAAAAPTTAVATAVADPAPKALSLVVIDPPPPSTTEAPTTTAPRVVAAPTITAPPTTAPPPPTTLAPTTTIAPTTTVKSVSTTTAVTTTVAKPPTTVTTTRPPTTTTKRGKK